MSAPSESTSTSEQHQTPPPFTELNGLNLEFETICELRGDGTRLNSRHGVTTVMHGRTLYAVGYDTFSCLDLGQTNPTWTVLDPMPTPRHVPRAVVVGDRIVVIGGILEHVSPARTVESFDIQTRIWTPLMPLQLQQEPLSTYKTDVCVVNDEEFLVVYNRQIGNDPWESSLEKYNVTGTGSSVPVSLSIQAERAEVRHVYSISRNKVLALVKRGSTPVAQNAHLPLDCVLVDFDSNRAKPLPRLLLAHHRPLVGLIRIESILFVFDQFGKSRMFDLDRIDGLGWRDVQGLAVPLLGTNAWMTYLENEKTILIGNLTTAKQLEMSPAFEVGTLKYKSLVSSTSNSRASPPFTELNGLNLEFETICELRDEDIPHHSHSGVTTVMHGRTLYAVGYDTFACLDLGQTNPTWTVLDPMPTSRHVPSAVVVGDRIVVIGGILEHVSPARTVESFDIQTRIWTPLMPLQLQQEPLSTYNTGVCVVNDEEFLVVYNRQIGNDQWESSLEKYNVTGTGSSEVLSLSIQRGRLFYVYTVGRNKVLALVQRTQNLSTQNEDGTLVMRPDLLECDLLDLDAETVTSLPPLLVTFLMGSIRIDSFVFVFDRDSNPQMLDLDRLDGMGWRDVQGLAVPLLGTNAWMTYLENEKTILIGNLTTAKQLDMSPAFKVGTLKYKSLVALFSNSQAPDGLISHALGRGGTAERWHLTYQLAKERPELFRDTTRRAPVEESDNEEERNTHELTM